MERPGSVRLAMATVALLTFEWLAGITHELVLEHRQLLRPGYVLTTLLFGGTLGLALWGMKRRKPRIWRWVRGMAWLVSLVCVFVECILILDATNARPKGVTREMLLLPMAALIHMLIIALALGRPSAAKYFTLRSAAVSLVRRAARDWCQCLIER